MSNLLTVSFAVHTAWPAARTAYTFNEFLVCSLDASLSSFNKLRSLNPTDPFVAG
jgi:hypothetical protein